MSLFSTLLLFVIFSFTTAGAVVFQNPPEVSAAANGVLDIVLVANYSTVPFETMTGQQQQVSLMLWNGSYIPPTLRLKPGETLQLTISNRFNETTNVHFHGKLSLSFTLFLFLNIPFVPCLSNNNIL